MLIHIFFIGITLMTTAIIIVRVVLGIHLFLDNVITDFPMQWYDR